MKSTPLINHTGMQLGFHFLERPPLEDHIATY